MFSRPTVKLTFKGDSEYSWQTVERYKIVDANTGAPVELEGIRIYGTLDECMRYFQSRPWARPHYMIVGEECLMPVKEESGQRRVWSVQPGRPT